MLLDVLPELPDASDRDAAAEALWACATPADAGRLREAVTAGPPPSRAAAAPALVAVSKDGSADLIEPLLRDTDERARLAAARALADDRPRPSAAALVGLLASHDPAVRLQAAWLLQQMSGFPQAPPESYGPQAPKPGDAETAGRDLDWGATVERLESMGRRRRSRTPQAPRPHAAARRLLRAAAVRILRACGGLAP